MISGHASIDFDNEYVTLIKRAESFSPGAYFNQGDVPTIGYGFAFITVDNNGVYTDRSIASLNGFFAGIHTFGAADENRAFRVRVSFSRPHAGLRHRSDVEVRIDTPD